MSVALALVFIGIRVFYTLVALCTRRADLSPINGSLAIRVILGFLSELIATLIYIAAGMKTQGAANVAGERRTGVSPAPSRKHRQHV